MNNPAVNRQRERLVHKSHRPSPPASNHEVRMDCGVFCPGPLGGSTEYAEAERLHARRVFEGGYFRSANRRFKKGVNDPLCVPCEAERPTFHRVVVTRPKAATQVFLSGVFLRSGPPDSTFVRSRGRGDLTVDRVVETPLYTSHLSDQTRQRCGAGVTFL